MTVRYIGPYSLPEGASILTVRNPNTGEVRQYNYNGVDSFTVDDDPWVRSQVLGFKTVGNQMFEEVV